MKICMLTTTFPAYEGDVQGPFLYEFCKSLSKEGMLLDIVCPADGVAKREEFMGKLRVHRFHYFFPKGLQRLTKGGGIPSNLEASFFAKLQFPFFFLAYLLRSLRYAKRCDVIHCQWSFSGLAGVFLKKLYKKPLILTERGTSAYLALRNPLMRKVLLFVLRNCDFVTTNNNHQLAAFRKLGIAKGKLLAISNGIDMQHFKPLNKKLCRKKVGWNKDQKVLLYVGRLVSIKGPDYLVKAMALVNKKRKDVHCYFIGGGIWEQKLKQMVKAYHLEDHVSFLGSKKPATIPTYLNAADFLVLPSLSEGRPNAVGEAFACGIPVIASDLPGAKEYLTQLPFGKLVPPKDASKLAAAILSALKKKWTPKKSAFARFRKTFTWRNSAQSYKQIYKQLLR